MFRLFIRETRVQLLANGLARMFLRYNALFACFPHAVRRGTSVHSKSPEKIQESIGSTRKALVNNVALTTLDCSKAVRLKSKFHSRIITSYDK